MNDQETQEQMGLDPDVELHLGILAHQKSALEGWDARYRSVMIANARRKGLNPIDAEHAYEEAFVQTMVKAPKLLPLGTGLRKFAYVVLRRRVADYYRKHHGVQETGLEESPLGSISSLSPTRDEGANEPSLRLRSCLERIAPRERFLLETLYVEEVPIEEVAERLALKVNSVRVARRRAVDALRKCMERDDV